MKSTIFVTTSTFGKDQGVRLLEQVHYPVIRMNTVFFPSKKVVHTTQLINELP